MKIKTKKKRCLLVEFTTHESDPSNITCFEDTCDEYFGIFKVSEILISLKKYALL